jgi:hypothetical protein
MLTMLPKSQVFQQSRILLTQSVAVKITVGLEIKWMSTTNLTLEINNSKITRPLSLHCKEAHTVYTEPDCKPTVCNFKPGIPAERRSTEHDDSSINMCPYPPPRASEFGVISAHSKSFIELLSLQCSQGTMSNFCYSSIQYFTCTI